MKISIITTNFNTAKYLEKTIQSVLSQKGDFKLEYIITDGGSTDGSLDIIKKYSDKLKYISEKDKGQSDGINKGLKMATGDIVAFLNADDLYTKGALQKVVNHFRVNPDCMWLTGYCRIINEDGEEISKHITLYKNWKLRGYTYNKFLIEDFISQPSTFWRKELLNEVGYFDQELHYAMDYDYWCRIGKKYPLHLLKEYLAEFRFTSDTKTGSNIDKTLEESKLVVSRYTNRKSILIRQHISNIKRIVAYKYISKLKNISKRNN